MTNAHSETSIELTTSNPSKHDSARQIRVQPETMGSTSSLQVRVKKPLLIPAHSPNVVAGSRVKPTTPLRTTKTSQKLVLLPEEEFQSTNVEDTSDVEIPVTPSSPIPAWDSTDPERMSKEVRDNKHYPRY